MLQNAIEIRALQKSFSNTPVLKGINLNVNEGEIFCLLGPNGSGKTTMINCMLSLLRPDGGDVLLPGHKHNGNGRKKIGVIMEEDGFYRDLSVEKNLKVVCLIKGVGFEVIPDLLEKVSLTEHRGKMVKKLSQGMRKRLAIACSLVGDPALLIWDEPYNSLDPTGFQFMRNLIAELHQQGKTLFISTHLLDEVKRTATRVGLIYQGEMQEILTMPEILQKHTSMDNFFFHHVPVH